MPIIKSPEVALSNVSFHCFFSHQIDEGGQCAFHRETNDIDYANEFLAADDRNVVVVCMRPGSAVFVNFMGKDGPELKTRFDKEESLRLFMQMFPEFRDFLKESCCP